MRHRRLFWRLFVLLMTITIAAILLGGLYSSRMVREFYLSELAADLEARAQLCAHQVADLLDARRAEGAEAFCRQLAGAGTRITVMLPSGRVIGDSNEDPRNMDNHQDRPEMRQALGGGVGQSTRYSATLRQELMYVAVPVKKGEEVIGVVRAAIPLTGIQQALAAVRLHVLLWGLASVGLIALVSLAVSRWVSRPWSRSGPARRGSPAANSTAVCPPRGSKKSTPWPRP